MSAASQHMAKGRSPALARVAQISVNEGYCINLRGRLKACDLCQRACHAKAITLGLDEVSVDPALCTACGACVPACPAGAISHDQFDPETMLAGAVEDGIARIGCAQAGAPAAARVIPCHRMLDARLMAALAAEGAQRLELSGTENCPGCPGGDARPALKLAKRTLAKWLGEATPVVVIPNAGANAGDRPRRGTDVARTLARRRFLRGAFGTVKDRGEKNWGETAVPDFDDMLAMSETGSDTAARPVPYQQALAARRARLPFGADSQVGATGRQIDDACNGCMVCADLCPTGALDGDVSPGYRLISFDPALCTNCTLCLKVCPMEAISARVLRGPDVVLAGRAVLFARQERVCTECGGNFAADSAAAICPDCENDKELDDEWLEMLSG
jgi:ferredoxin